MDQLISIVEDLQREVEKVPNSDMCCIQKEMENLRDQWLVVSVTPLSIVYFFSFQKMIKI